MPQTHAFRFGVYDVQTASVAEYVEYARKVEAFGYSHEAVARIVLHLPGGGQAQTSTFTYFGSNAIRLWHISLPAHLDFTNRTFTVTAYNLANQVVQTDTLGTIG